MKTIYWLNPKTKEKEIFNRRLCSYLYDAEEGKVPCIHDLVVGKKYLFDDKTTLKAHLIAGEIVLVEVD